MILGAARVGPAAADVAEVASVCKDLGHPGAPRHGLPIPQARTESQGDLA